MGFDLFSPGCNCKLIYTPSTNNGCEGVLTWCTKIGATVKLQKQVSGNWTDIQTFGPSDLQYYIINSSNQTGNYRIQCEVCPGKVVTSDTVNVTTCGTHSFWFRWYKNATDYTVGNQTLGAELVSGSIRDKTTGNYLVVGGSFDLLAGLCPGVWLAVPDSWPIAAQAQFSILGGLAGGHGCSTDTTTTREEDLKIFSIETSIVKNRSGFSFDYRYFQNVFYPSCNPNPSIHYLFPANTVLNLGGVLVTQISTVSFTEIATVRMKWTSGSGFKAVSGITGSSGVSYNWNATRTSIGDVSINTGNPGFGGFPTLLINSSTENLVITGSEYPVGTCNWSPYYNPVLYFPPFVNSHNIGFPTEYKTRTCNEYANGLNPLPPGSVSTNQNWSLP